MIFASAGTRFFRPRLLYNLCVQGWDHTTISDQTTNIGHYGTGEAETILGDFSELDDVMYMIGQAYKHTLYSFLLFFLPIMINAASDSGGG